MKNSVIKNPTIQQSIAILTNSMLVNKHILNGMLLNHIPEKVRMVNISYNDAEVSVMYADGDNIITITEKIRNLR